MGKKWKKCHKKKGKWFLVYKSLTFWIQTQQDLLKFLESRKEVTIGIVFKPKSFQPNKFCYSSSMDLKGSDVFLFPLKELIEC
jgi:hypothetical protein